MVIRRALIVDAMLGSLARKLRIYGFDTVYDKDSEDSSMLVAAKIESRTLVTCDKELHKLAVQRNLQSILLNKGLEVEKMVEVIRGLDLKPLMICPEESRCPLCNGDLIGVSNLIAPSSIPQSIRQRHQRFYICRLCGKSYWEGSHWEKISSFSADVEERLSLQ